MHLTRGVHLTYCTNIHAGEDLAAVRAALAQHVTRVKRAMRPEAPFGVGLRLSNLASEQLAREGALAELRTWLDREGLYVFTLNGFPYGAFHGTRVKESVYEPDWRSPARLAYTNRLADQLAQLLPDGVSGSVSTVPCAWKAALTHRDDVGRMAEHMLQHAAHLHALRERRGVTVSLALEPEPGCFLETIDDAVRFFETQLFSPRAATRFRALTGIAPRDALPALQRHLGLCLDTCHAAVEFEDPAQIFGVLERAGIGIKKLQLSAGLRIPRLNTEALDAVAAFADNVYLHQTVQQQAGVLTRHADLPDALRQAASAGPQASEREWRVHCHVPVFLESFGVLESTRAFLVAVLERQRAGVLSEHLEVETYTWDVLPAALREGDVAVAIARELNFVLSVLDGEPGR